MNSSCCTAPHRIASRELAVLEPNMLLHTCTQTHAQGHLQAQRSCINTHTYCHKGVSLERSLLCCAAGCDLLQPSQTETPCPQTCMPGWVHSTQNMAGTAGKHFRDACYSRLAMLQLMQTVHPTWFAAVSGSALSSACAVAPSTPTTSFPHSGTSLTEGAPPSAAFKAAT
jgi:hypothetical protein